MQASQVLQDAKVDALLSPEHRAIFDQLQQAEIEKVLRQQVKSKVQASVQRIKLNTANQI
jgi:hypothetical protein